MGISIPGFFGYFNAHRAFMANQAALETVNHNIANANTEGYSRQRVDLAAMDPYTIATPYNNFQSGQLGQGVQITNLTRAHDNFLDTQIRNQNSSLEFQTMVRDTLQELEGIMGEPVGDGISTAMTKFFEAAQTLSKHPDDLAIRANFMQASEDMLYMFQHIATQLVDVRTTIVGDPADAASFNTTKVSFMVDDINESLQEVADLNDKILKTGTDNGIPNDLLDRRDLLLEQLSEQINITVDYRDNNTVNVRLGSNKLVQGNLLLDTLQAVPNANALTMDDTPTEVQLVSTGAVLNAQITGGRLGGYLAVGDVGSGTIREVLDGISTLFDGLAQEVNLMQAAGRDLYGNVPTAPDDEIFTAGGASPYAVFNYTINSDLITDPKLLAAAIDDPLATGGFAGVGDGRNALAIAQLATNAIAALGTNAHDYFKDQLANLGTTTHSIADRVDNLNQVSQQLEQRRQSVQGVNMEEEMMDMLRFQRGFEASAKVLNTLDSIMDLIINKLI